jgi:hypothetical protein
MQSRRNEQDQVPLGFNTAGCWVRVLQRPLEELQRLAFRHDLPSNELLGHNNSNTPGYTPYSCCTYLKQGLAISLYSGTLDDDFGVFIRPLNRKIDWFYNGCAEIATDKLWDCSMEEIAALVMNLRNQYAQDSYYKRNPKETVSLKWNEGFLRHQRQDITGILVNSNSKISVLNALAFRKALQLNVGLFEYGQENGLCYRLGSARLCEIHKISLDSQAFHRIKDAYENQFKSELAVIRNMRATENPILK